MVVKMKIRTRDREGNSELIRDPLNSWFIRRYDYCSIDNFDQFDQMCFSFVLFNDDSFDQFVQMSFWFCVVQR